MKIAVTSKGTSMDSPVDPRFGRSPYIAFVDLQTDQLEALANPFADASGGAGVQAAQFVLDQGARALLTGHCGPRASTVLSDAGVQVVNGASGTVREAVESYRQTEKVSADAAASKVDAEPALPGRGPGGGFGRGLGRGAGGGGGGRRRGPGGRFGGGRGGGRGPGGGGGPGRGA
jgi:predicted Fe-Mo cluster-binding NifX family protein